MMNDGKALRNLVLISQLSISVMVPAFLCLALGLWLDGRFGTWFTVPLLFLGLIAGGRNAYVLAMNTVRMDEEKRRKAEQEKMERTVEEYRRRTSDEDGKRQGGR